MICARYKFYILILYLVRLLQSIINSNSLAIDLFKFSTYPLKFSVYYDS